MKIATWNINSIRARLERLPDWLEKSAPDLACLQELKTKEDSFPQPAIRAAGYHPAVYGQPTYNGAAILSLNWTLGVGCVALVACCLLLPNREAEAQQADRSDRPASVKRSDRMNGSVRIVAFGDSITNGVGVEERDTFRAVTGKELTERLERPVEVVNAGVNGDVVTLATGRLDKDVLDHKPDIVTVMFGGNEAGFYRPETDGFANTPRVERADFEEALGKIVDRLRAAGITVVLITCPPMTEQYWGAHLEPYRKHGINFLVKDYAQAMRDVAAEKRVELIDVYAEFQQNRDTPSLFRDGLHPNARGHRVIAGLLVPRLAQIIDPDGR